MAQLNIILNPNEILQLLLADREVAFRKLLQRTLNDILKVEPQEQLQAAPYERSDSRLNSLNGLRARKLKTRIGRITLAVPRHRNVSFKTLIFDNYSRSEAALVAAMAEMVVNGVSTCKVSRVIRCSGKAFGYRKGTGNNASRLIRLIPEGNLHTNMDLTEICLARSLYDELKHIFRIIHRRTPKKSITPIFQLELFSLKTSLNFPLYRSSIHKKNLSSPTSQECYPTTSLLVFRRYFAGMGASRRQVMFIGLLPSCFT